MEGAEHVMADKVKLGRTDLYVNPIGLGTNAVGGHNIYPNLNDETGREMIRAAIRSGVNFLDTAFYYGLGRSEELIGEVVKEMGARHDVIIATKGGNVMRDGVRVIDNSPAALKAHVEESLRRLQTDYIDLYYIHYPDESTPKAEAVGTLQRLKEEGKIRAIGVCNFSLDQLREANQDGYLDVIQDHYSLLVRDHEKDLLPFAREHGISFIPYFPLAAGLLTGKYKADTKFTDGREKRPMFQPGVYEQNIAKVEQLREIASAKGAEIAHVTLAWYLTRDEIDAVIPGAKRPEQVKDNLRTLDVKLTQDEIDRIDRIFR
jgi:aryl-alcohol dehydrogenase-like predicted oxidoreductase